METFHITVLAIAVVVLILILIFMGILLSMGNENVAWPPSYGDCPDYWTFDEEHKKCVIPKYEPKSVNIGNMYDKESKTLNDNILNTPGYSYDASGGIVTQYIDFNNTDWKGTCDKKTWANTNNIVWDGISNYNNC